MKFQEGFSELIDKVNGHTAPQEAIRAKLNGLTAELQSKMIEFKNITKENPDGDVSKLYKQIQKLKEKIEMLNLQLSAFPDEMPGDFEGRLKKIIEKAGDSEIIEHARETITAGIEEMSELQKRINMIMMKEYPLAKQKMLTIIEELGDLEREKFNLADRITDLDVCFPKTERKHVRPQGSSDWVNLLDEDDIGKAFGAKPQFVVR